MARYTLCTWREFSRGESSKETLGEKGWLAGEEKEWQLVLEGGGCGDDWGVGEAHCAKEGENECGV